MGIEYMIFFVTGYDDDLCVDTGFIAGELFLTEEAAQAYANEQIMSDDRLTGSYSIYPVNVGESYHYDVNEEE